MLPAVERRLVVRRHVPRVEPALAVNLALVPYRTADKLESDPTKEIYHQGTQCDALVAHRGERHDSLVVKIVEDIVRVECPRTQRSEDFSVNPPHVVQVAIQVRPLRVLSSVVVRR